MSRTIRLGLSVSEVNAAIRELNAYKTQAARRAETLRERVAEALAEEARAGFGGSVIDDLLPGYGSARAAEVTVRVDGSGDTVLVVASGEDAVWAEFGAGVAHNGGAGQSPNPWGADLGFTIGSYGKGRGKRKTWGYYRDGALVLTHGTEATMPMYRAMQSVCGRLDELAREVYGA